MDNIKIGKSINMGNYYIHTIALSVFVVLTCISCSHNNGDGENLNTCTSVTLTKVVRGSIRDSLALPGVTAYMKHNVVTAPIAGFIKETYLLPGTEVKRGQKLFVMESKEARALSSLTEGKEPYGIMVLRAAERGVVIDVSAQTGCYEAESTPLATIADLSSLYVKMEMPCEDSRKIGRGTRCHVVLPDNTTAEAIVAGPLPTVDVTDQSQGVVVKLLSPRVLPEGMNVQVIIEKQRSKRTCQLLPRSAVMSDEDMKQFWVMKVEGNNKAIKVPVTIGNSDARNIEILSPALSMTDKIVLTGGYGLNDGAKVIVDYSANK